MRAIGRIFAALIGFILAVIAAALFMLFASVGFKPADPADSFWFWSNFGVGAAMTASYLGAMALAPWAVIVVITEAFRLRSALIYLVAGGVLGVLPALGIAPMMHPLDGGSAPYRHPGRSRLRWRLRLLAGSRSHGRHRRRLPDRKPRT